MTEPEARYFMRHTILGCQYLHNNRVIHRDLKLGNLFINDDMDVKIGKKKKKKIICLFFLSFFSSLT